jgi:hypothetical protein
MEPIPISAILSLNLMSRPLSAPMLNPGPVGA